MLFYRHTIMDGIYQLMIHHNNTHLIKMGDIFQVKMVTTLLIMSL